jgi:hypothetical protein
MPAKRGMIGIIAFSYDEYLKTKIINNLTKYYQILHGYLFYQQLKQLNSTTLRGNQLPAALAGYIAKLKTALYQ